MSKILGIDYGKARIGLAISNEAETLAERLDILSNPQKALSQLITLIQEKHIATIVIGNPLDAEGNPTEISQEVQTFATTLHESLTAQDIAFNIIFWNETMTSYEAYENLFSRGKSHKKIKEVLDAEAARIILQEYLDNKDQL
jgi:putative holliday junction resolvase